MRWAWVGPYPTAFEECLPQTTLEQEKITATHMAFFSSWESNCRDISMDQCFSCKNYGHITANYTKNFYNYYKSQGHVIKDC